MPVSPSSSALRFTALATLLGCAPLAVGSEFNNRVLPTGERAAGFGGAYVALADDDTGILYNPAGLAYADHGKPTATVNLISGSSTSYENVFGAIKWTRDSLGVVPSFFGTSRAFGDWTLGGALVVLDYASEDQTNQYRDVTVGTTTFDDLRVHNDSSGQVYNVGLSLARNFRGSGWSAGLSTFLHFAERDRTFSQRLSIDSDPNTLQDDTSILVNVQSDDQSIGIRPVLGVQLRRDEFSLGLSVSQLYLFERDYAYSFTSAAFGTGADAALNFDQVDETGRREDQPVHLSAGFALFADADTTYSFQIDYTTPRDVDSDAQVARALPPRDLDTRAVVNVAMGLETALSPQWVMRVGAYTDLANNRADEAVRFERREEIDIYGLAFSLSRRREQGYWTLGFDVSHGNGEATLGDIGFTANADGIERVDASRSAFNLMLSTTW